MAALVICRPGPAEQFSVRITVTVLILVSVWCELSVIKHNCWWISIFMKRETLWKVSGFPLRTHFLFHGWCYELVLYQTRCCTKPVQWWSAQCAAAAAVWLQCVAWHSYVFTVLVKSRWLAQRARPDCGCLNILLPVRAIYNVPVHGPLSAVSNLHLWEHFGSGVDGRIEGQPGRRARVRPWSAFKCLCLDVKRVKYTGKVQVWSHLSQEEWWRIGYTHAQNVHVCLRMTCVCVPPPSYCMPILSTRQKAHLDLVGWKVGLLHRALLVNGGLLLVSRATLPPPPPSVRSRSLSAWISTCPPCLKLPSSANIWNFAS